MNDRPDRDGTGNVRAEKAAKSKKTRRAASSGSKSPGPKPTDSAPPGEATQGGDALHLAALAEDWIALWQSELAALAVDRESRETWQGLMALWGSAAHMWLRAPLVDPTAFGARDVGKRRPSQPETRPESRPDAPRQAAATRAAPASAAPDVRDAEIDRLHRCIAELERRLADVERSAGKPAANRRYTGRVGRKR